MPSTLAAKFDTRREAEMTVERLVQEFGIERTDIFVTTDGEANSAGIASHGADVEATSSSTDDRGNAALTGRIIVSVDVQDDGKTRAVRSAFIEFEGD